jgi:hypothetical protein
VLTKAVPAGRNDGVSEGDDVGDDVGDKLAVVEVVVFLPSLATEVVVKVVEVVGADVGGFDVVVVVVVVVF